MAKNRLVSYSDFRTYISTSRAADEVYVYSLALGEAVDMKEILCLRCNNIMTYSGRKKIQLGETGWILGDLPNLLAEPQCH